MKRELPERSKELELSQRAVELCEVAFELGGERFEPDDSKGYIVFRLSHAFPVVTRYGTALHPGTVARSWQSLRHQVLNWGHQMKAYGKKDLMAGHDAVLGTVVAVEFDAMPVGGWKISREKASAPGIRAAAVIHKAAERAGQVVEEHSSGRRRYTVSMEVDYPLVQSGFVIMEPGKVKGAEAKLLAGATPEEFSQAGYGYVSAEEAPEELLDTYDFAKKEMKSNARWGGSPVVLLKGGINGEVHYCGVGLVHYGAESEAGIEKMLMSDDGMEQLRGYFEAVKEGLENAGK